MNALDKAFIKAYGLQAAAPREMIPLSAALELSRENESVCPAEEQKPSEDQVVVNDEPVTETASPEFQPLFQVDSFIWPKICKQLDDTAGDQLEAVADRVDRQAEKGRKMIGFIGDQAGSGCTTLLLAVARRLAERCRVVLIDANRHNSAISRELGILPEVGLKDVAAGSVSISEALIESLGDHLTILPYAGHTETEYGADANACFKDLRLLANYYDIVLVDLGAEYFAHGENSTLSQVDAAVIVRDTRGQRSNESCQAKEILQAFGVDVVGNSEACRTKEILQAFGVNVVGVVENRVSGADETRPPEKLTNPYNEALAQDMAAQDADDFNDAA